MRTRGALRIGVRDGIRRRMAGRPGPDGVLDAEAPVRPLDAIGLDHELCHWTREPARNPAEHSLAGDLRGKFRQLVRGRRSRIQKPRCAPERDRLEELLLCRRRPAAIGEPDDGDRAVPPRIAGFYFHVVTEVGGGDAEILERRAACDRRLPPMRVGRLERAPRVDVDVEVVPLDVEHPGWALWRDGARTAYRRR